MAFMKVLKKKMILLKERPERRVLLKRYPQCVKSYEKIFFRYYFNANVYCGFFVHVRQRKRNNIVCSLRNREQFWLDSCVCSKLNAPSSFMYIVVHACMRFVRVDDDEGRKDKRDRERGGDRERKELR